MSALPVTLYEKAKNLLALASRIEKASNEEEENRLCDERDRILRDFRRADALIINYLTDNKETS